MINAKSKFITLEGGEGAGKTTNLSFIKTYLEQQGIDVVVTREPGGTPLAEKIRGLLLQTGAEESVTDQAELLLMFAARAQHIQHVIKPALSAGKWVLCDRFSDATYAYQGGGRQMPVTAIDWLAHFVQEDLRPDLTLLFDLPIEIGMGRAKSRGGEIDRFESQQLDFFNRVRSSYLQRAREFPDRIQVISADRTLETIQVTLVEKLAPLFSG